MPQSLSQLFCSQNGPFGPFCISAVFPQNFEKLFPNFNYFVSSPGDLFAFFLKYRGILWGRNFLFTKGSPLISQPGRSYLASSQSQWVPILLKTYATCSETVQKHVPPAFLKHSWHKFNQKKTPRVFKAANRNHFLA